MIFRIDGNQQQKKIKKNRLIIIEIDLKTIFYLIFDNNKNDITNIK